MRLRQVFIVIKPLPADHNKPIAVTDRIVIDEEFSISIIMLSNRPWNSVGIIFSKRFIRSVEVTGK